MSEQFLDPPVGGTLACVRAALPTLNPSERRVAAVVLDRAADVREWTVADLAGAAGTSRASTVRACQRMGFKGFQHLRILLVRDIASAAPRGGPALDPQAEPAEVARGVFRTVADALGESLAPLDGAEFARAVDAVAATPRLLVLGNGGSAPAAQGAALRLMRRGRSAEAPGDAIVQEVTARTLGPGDVCLAISDSGLNLVTLRGAAAARAAGATVVGLTSFHRSELARHADVVLVAGPGGGPFSSRVQTGGVVQTLLLNALEICVQARDLAAGRQDAAELATVADFIERPETGAG
ncbi:MurR/RpiR family transcriptional regulator [Streptomyces sp. RFCAC02]|uniref:MurR/RpiR family transcriptional regulator n=1 Tax=Streptomyces sp. RFCAC02 TaxID=2499143 RepID=UPI00143CC29B|nr:MurR/RpiR family transcriptional regulator [Streptomyces sp. RFCAC02]